MPQMTLTAEIQPEQMGQRLDQTLAELFPEYSRSRLKTWIEAKQVKMNGEIADIPRAKVYGGEQIEISVEVEDENRFEPQNIPLNIVYEDDDIIVINKPKDLVVHPGAGNPDGTVLNALLYHYPPIAEVPRAGIVHRLDKDTSGLMVVARTSLAQTSLVRQLQDRTVGRRYLAWVWGDAPSQGKVLASVGRDQRDRLKMAAGSPQGKPAATLFRRLAKGLVKGSPVTLLECRLETGRTHQIRVHLESLGFPLVGDPVYRKKTPGVAKDIQFSRQALHAFALSLQHPVKNELMTWFRLPPQDILDLLPQLEMDDEVLPKEAVVLASIQNESQA